MSSGYHPASECPVIGYGKGFCRKCIKEEVKPLPSEAKRRHKAEAADPKDIIEESSD